MNELNQKSSWSSGDAYEPYIGRWSRLVAREFLRWLGPSYDLRWLDVGCGTGALSHEILNYAMPVLVQGIDPSEDYIKYARAHTADKRIKFNKGDARELPYPESSFDFVVSGLALNFVPQPTKVLQEMMRVVRKTGTVAVYVWDYADKMEMIRYFWDAAIKLDPEARRLDEGIRFPMCQRVPLMMLFKDSGLQHVEVNAIEIHTSFASFDDYWSPFLGGQGPAPGYAMSLTEDHRAELRELIRSRLPVKRDGRIDLIARAWAVEGQR